MLESAQEAKNQNDSATLELKNLITSMQESDKDGKEQDRQFQAMMLSMLQSQQSTAAPNVPTTIPNLPSIELASNMSSSFPQCNTPQITGRNSNSSEFPNVTLPAGSEDSIVGYRTVEEGETSYCEYKDLSKTITPFILLARPYFHLKSSTTFGENTVCSFVRYLTERPGVWVTIGAGVEKVNYSIQPEFFSVPISDEFNPGNSPSD